MRIGDKFINKKGYVFEIVDIRDSGTLVIKYPELGEFREIDEETIKNGLVFGWLAYYKERR